jgi:hypothetical protein
MTIADDIKAVLVADTGAGGVNTLLTGGIYTYEDTGRLGINRDSASSAFDSTTGLLKPCCVVKERSQIGDSGIRDVAVASYREVVELWFYNDGNATYDTLESARDRAFLLLDGLMIGGDKRVPLWMGNVLKDRDGALNNAVMLRADYDVRGIA